MTRFATGLNVDVELRAWARPGPDQTLDELIALQNRLGNEVILIDRDNDRLELALKE